MILAIKLIVIPMTLPKVSWCVWLWLLLEYHGLLILWGGTDISPPPDISPPDTSPPFSAAQDRSPLSYFRQGDKSPPLNFSNNSFVPVRILHIKMEFYTLYIWLLKYTTYTLNSKPPLLYCWEALLSREQLGFTKDLLQFMSIATATCAVF